jgi:molecular chaperone GrpE
MKEEHHGGTSPSAVDPLERSRETETADAGSAGDRVAQLERERDDHYDRLLRVTAEFDNFRKRNERERRDISERAVAGLVEELLAVVDDLERALGADLSSDPAALRQGVALIQKQLLDLLQRRGVRAIEAVGHPFDPQVHQAVMYEAAPGHEDGEVVEELRRGYMLGDRLLRPSMVKVAKA